MLHMCWMNILQKKRDYNDRLYQLFEFRALHPAYELQTKSLEDNIHGLIAIEILYLIIFDYVVDKKFQVMMPEIYFIKL